MSGWYDIRARSQINTKTRRNREKTKRHGEDQEETLRRDQETEQTDSLRESEAERLRDSKRC